MTGAVWSTSGIEIVGLGRYFPGQPIANEDLVPTNTTPIEQQVLGVGGVRTRHRCADDQDLADLATEAVNHALSDAGIDGSEVDVLMLSNWTDRWCAPEWGALVATRVGAEHAMGFDLCGGCAGFVQGVHTAAMFLSSPAHYETAVVASAERFSRRVRPGSKGELVVSDGAGAAVLRRTGTSGLIDSAFHSNGELSHMSTVHPGNGWVRSQPELNDVAVKHVLIAVKDLLARNDITPDDIDWVVPHSATEPFNQALRAELGIDPDKIVNNLATRGNLSSASIPTTLSEYVERGTLQRGDLVLSPSLGGGVWCYGGLLYRL
ncbi:ketoacyl-ACP synthase III [Amycolatopsis anabasis]|uniref:ketoacyl-ACP synthase III n=1 Tax=Amycolatopsis anabasis TaxID=1840409 RepID=UPI00131C7C3F|nr:ketoacyl-ACP synthase III [Amycolatopsis anabasis]